MKKLFALFLALFITTSPCLAQWVGGGFSTGGGGGSGGATVAGTANQVLVNGATAEVTSGTATVSLPTTVITDYFKARGLTDSMPTLGAIDSTAQIGVIYDSLSGFYTGALRLSSDNAGAPKRCYTLVAESGYLKLRDTSNNMVARFNNDPAGTNFVIYDHNSVDMLNCVNGSSATVMAVDYLGNTAGKTLRVYNDTITAGHKYNALTTAALSAANRTCTLPDADSNTVIPDAGASNNFLTGITSGGVITKAQPTFNNIASGAIANGTTVTTQSQGDNSTKPASTAYVDTAVAAGGASTNQKTITLNFTIDGGGAPIATGVKGDLICDFNGTIQNVTMVADQSGSCVVDVWKAAYTLDTPPTVANTITASAKPTLSSHSTSKDSTLTGWTTSISAGDVIRFNVDSATTVQRVLVSIKVLKS